MTSLDSLIPWCDRIVSKQDHNANEDFLKNGYSPDFSSLTINTLRTIAQEELRWFLGWDLMREVMRTDRKFGKGFSSEKIIITPQGGVVMSISVFAPYSISISIKDDLRLSRAIRISFNEAWLASNFTVDEDPENKIAQLFSFYGSWKLSQAFFEQKNYIGRAVDRKKLLDLRQEVEFQRCFREDAQRISGVSQKEITRVFRGRPGEYVSVDEYMIASIETPLATMGLVMCAALVIIDLEGKRHLLAHIFPETPIESIDAALKRLWNLNEKKIYIMKWVTIDSPTPIKILTALSGKVDISRIQFVSVRTKGNELPRIVTYNWELFDVPKKLSDDWGKWRAQKFHSFYHAQREYFESTKSGKQ